MTWFRNLSIRLKLVVLVVSITIGALLIATTLFCVYDWQRLRDSLVADVEMLADVVGSNSHAAVMFEDDVAAAAVLASLAGQTQISCGFLYGDHGRILARYESKTLKVSCVAPPSPAFDRAQFGPGILNFSRRLSRDGTVIGGIHLVADLGFVSRRLRGYLSTAMLIACAAILAAVLVTLRLQGLFTEPILTLSSMAREVSKNKDYSLRANARYHDEIGSLVMAFNAMLSEIQVRDATLSRSEERMRIILESAADGIVITDEQGVIESMNTAARRLFGEQSDDLIGHSVSEVFDGGISLGRNDFVQRGSRENVLLPEHTPGTMEVVARRRDGSGFPADIAISTAASRAGALRIVIIRDLTEKKAAENEKQRLESSLRQAQKMEAVGVLAGGIAHDFNNLLAAIIGHAQLSLKHVPEETRPRKNIERILQAGHRAKDLVKQLLTFSRQTDVNIAVIDLAEVVDESIGLLKASLPSMITLKAELDCDCRCVQADPTQIQQIILNLSTNAYHAIGERPGTITLAVDCMTVDAPLDVHDRQLPPGRYVQLSVRDDGAGMDEKTRARIFEPFFTTKEISKGTGMGLAVVHGIVTSYKGGVSVESTVGAGTTFRIYLPVADTKAPQKETHEQIVARGNARVLLVDDEPLVAEMAAELLEDLGYQVSVFTESPVALAAFRSRPGDFDIVVTDFAMPMLTGVQLAGEIAKVRPELPIIIASGYSKDLTAVKAGEMGFKAYLTKPYDDVELGRALTGVLQAAGEA